MAFEIEEVEVSEYDPIKLVRTLYPNMNVSDALDAYAAELNKRFTYEEFWSDPCWTLPL